MDILFTNAKAVLPKGDARPVSIAINGGRFSAIGTDLAPAAHTRVIDCHNAWFAPGLFDLQVNGGGGVLFNDVPSVQGLIAIAKAHRQLGTRWFLPTLISDRLEIVDAGMRAVEQAIKAGHDSILGIHLEGPFLSPERCGIHTPEHMRPMDEDAIALFTSLKVGRTLVTLAPEQADAETISRLTRAGVTVSLGHSNASYKQAKQALQAGASGFTHLFNAMSPLQSREPGLVGAALSSASAWTSLILDSHHVSSVTADIAFNARPLDKFVLITDAMPPAGTDMTSFELQGRKITVENGSCRDASGTLAGAFLSLPEAIFNAVNRHGIQPETAIRMASQYPAEFMSMGTGIARIEIGAPANAILLSDKFGVLGQLTGGTWSVEEPAPLPIT